MSQYFFEPFCLNCNWKLSEYISPFSTPKGEKFSPLLFQNISSKQSEILPSALCVTLTQIHRYKPLHHICTGSSGWFSLKVNLCSVSSLAACRFSWSMDENISNSMMLLLTFNHEESVVRVMLSVSVLTNILAKNFTTLYLIHICVSQFV